MNAINMHQFNQSAPQKLTSDGAFLWKYYPDQREEINYPKVHRKQINDFRDEANRTLIDGNFYRSSPYLDRYMAQSTIEFSPFLAIVYEPNTGNSTDADAWLRQSAVCFKQIFSLDNAQAIGDFLETVQEPFFILPYHLVEMLRNQAEWQCYKDYLNFDIKPLSRSKPHSGYVLSNNGVVCELCDYKASQSPIQHLNHSAISLSIHGLTAFKLYQSIINPMSANS